MRLQQFGGLLLISILLNGCAGAIPTMSGASTTPHYRTDIGTGLAARIPTGKLKTPPPGASDSHYRRTANAGGVVPLAFARYGLSKNWDLGIMASGTSVRASFRGQRLLSDGSTRTSLIYGIAPYGGWITERDNAGKGGRVGLDAPLIWGANFGSLYEIWFGARAGAEYAWGDFKLGAAQQKANAFGLRVGPVFGMAIGLRRFHILVELSALYEQWFIDHGSDQTRGGIVLVPATALRIRI